MNWRRALFRIWLAGAAAWIAYIVYDRYTDCVSLWRGPWMHDICVSDAGPLNARLLLTAAVPPAAVFLLGIVLVWCVAGFQKANRPGLPSEPTES
jgi:hypothetical protein